MGNSKQPSRKMSSIVDTRVEDLMTEGTVYWITGLAGAGKTTVARLLFEYLRRQKPNVVLLDGDTLREVYGDELGHALEDRRKIALRNSRLCRLLAEQGMDVVCATISMFHECRRWNRECIQSYREIYLKVPMEVLARRDQKGLYSQLRDGGGQNVIGGDLAAEEPELPDLIIVNDDSISPEEALNQIVDKLIGRNGKEISGRKP